MLRRAPCFALEHRWVQQGKLRLRQVGSGNSSSEPQGTLRLQVVQQKPLTEHSRGQTVTFVLMCV